MIYFTEEMRQQAIRENKVLQEIKTHEHKGCGEKSDAWIGALGEICFAWLLQKQRSQKQKGLATHTSFLDVFWGSASSYCFLYRPNSLALSSWPSPNHPINPPSRPQHGPVPGSS